MNLFLSQSQNFVLKKINGKFGGWNNYQNYFSNPFELLFHQIFANGSRCFIRLNIKDFFAAVVFLSQIFRFVPKPIWA